MSELEFTFAFEKYLRRGSLLDFPKISGVYREISSIQGIPDIITIHGKKPKNGQLKNLKRALDQAGRLSFNILSILSSSRPHTIKYILKRLRVTEQIALRSISGLEDIGLIVRTHRNSYLLKQGFEIPYFEVCAFELKISNWKRALFQTTQAKAFADLAVAVFPIEKESLIKLNSGSFERMQVGLLLFDAKNSTHEFIVKPTRSTNKIENYKLYTLAQIAKENQPDF